MISASKELPWNTCAIQNICKKYSAKPSPGFYQCVLTDPPRLIFAGQNLCSLLGCTVQDLCCDDIHAYLSFVHPSDRERYLFHIAALRKNAHVRSIEYRLQPTSGDVVWVKETMRSTHLSDGKFVGEAVLADITDIKKRK